MLNDLQLENFLDNSELKSLLEDLITVIEIPLSIETLDNRILLGQPSPSYTEAYPIKVQQKTIGWVKGESQAQIIAQLLTYLANQERRVFFDDLTQIPNRRYFNRYFQQEWGRSQRQNQPLSLLLCDLDYFKFYNDYYGHQRGDTCLQQVAQMLQEVLKRRTDLAFRYGGEEFAIILPNTESAGAQILAEQLVQRIRQQEIPHYVSPIKSYVTISIGIAVMVPCTEANADTLINQADLALYRAKATGRDRCCLQV
ncbi:MAG: diguanylate cyclase [Cyanobacteria bacterium P01_G01_bin.49]